MIKAVFLSWLVFLTILITLWVRTYFMSEEECRVTMDGHPSPRTVLHTLAMLTSFFVALVITVITIVTF